MQEIANDSTTLISRALGKAANVLEVLSETTHLLLYRIRFCAKIPGDSARAQDDQQMLKCRADVCPTSRNRIGAGASRQMVIHEAAGKSIVDPSYGYAACCEPVRKVRDAPHVTVDGASRVAGLNEIFAVALRERRKDAAP
jgi:hypothetical protein